MGTAVRCPHCGLPHDPTRRLCPATGLPLPGAEIGPLPGAQGDAALVRAPVAPPRPSAPGTARPPLTRPRRARAQAVAQQPRRGKYAADMVGETIEGKYALQSVLGKGGMGTVYDAVHQRTSRRVAVKILLPEHAEKPESIARFHHEARVVAAIGHPNICEILDFGRLADGRPFLVMERLEGETLGTLLERRIRLPVGEAVAVAIQALQALDVAHAKGVIHRDMKPDNVFLTARSNGAPLVKVLDFGISKTFGDDRDVELTRTGMVMGTPYYMAPEQARGERNLDPRVDVWACGIILYEAIGGRRPFIAKNYNALLVEILTAAHRPLIEIAPQIPGGLEAVIDRALSKRREDRQPTVAALASALSPYAGELPQRPTGPVRARLDRYVEVGGAQLPVTWEDTGGETPASGGARMLEVGALRVAVVGSASETPTRAAQVGASQRVAPTVPRATGKPPMVEDEETTRIVSDPSTEERTPSMRRRLTSAPPPAPPAEEDVETTIVDQEPPTFTTDAYRPAKDRKEKR